LRTEIENALINGEIKVSHIEELWNEKTKTIFGFTPSAKSQGYLQDIHWSDGLIGYFPTYTMGNLISAQFYHKMQKDIGTVSQFKEDDLKKISKWFSENLYSKGNMYKSSEVVKSITGEDLRSDYFINYLNDKFLKIYS